MEPKMYRFVYQFLNGKEVGTGIATMKVDYDPFTTAGLTKTENDLINHQNHDRDREEQMNSLTITNIISLND